MPSFLMKSSHLSDSYPPKSQPLEISSNAIDLEGPVLRSSLHGIGDVREMQEHRPGEMIAGEVLKVSVTRFQTRSA